MAISDLFSIKVGRGKIMKSQWIKLFILTSILQLVAVAILEGRVLSRNKKFKEAVPNLKDCKASQDRMTLIIQENIIFILFQIFQLGFCLNAVFNENTIQMLTLTIINFLCGFYGIVQIFEVRKWANDLTDDCDNSIGTKQFLSVDVPLVAALGIFALIMAVISFALYKEFGWKIYKKIGADIVMQKIYGTKQIFVMLLKLDLFFVLLLSIEVFFAFSEDKGISPGNIDFTFKLPKGLYYFHMAITILIFFLELLAYQSINKEWKEGMITYITLSTIVIIDFVLVLKAATSTVKNSWYFFIFFLSVAIILCALTWMYAILVLRNFGKGLKEVLSRNRKNNTNIDEDPEIGSSNQAGNAEKFVID